VESWEKWSGFPVISLEGSHKGHTRVRVGKKDDGKRWVDLMREEEPHASSYRDTQGPEYPGLD